MKLLAFIAPLIAVAASAPVHATPLPAFPTECLPLIVRMDMPPEVADANALLCGMAVQADAEREMAEEHADWLLNEMRRIVQGQEP